MTESAQPDPSMLLSWRASGIIENIVPLIALAKQHGMSVSELVTWNVTHYTDCGFHHAWIAQHGYGNVRAFVNGFVQGRQMLYDHVTVHEHNDQITITSDMWYLDTPPASFFFFDIEMTEFRAYAAGVVVEHAKRLGVHLDIAEVDGQEIAQMRPLVTDERTEP